jgi:hypothetical protein
MGNGSPCPGHVLHIFPAKNVNQAIGNGIAEIICNRDGQPVQNENKQKNTGYDTVKADLPEFLYF